MSFKEGVNFSCYWNKIAHDDCLPFHVYEIYSGAFPFLTDNVYLYFFPLLFTVFILSRSFCFIHLLGKKMSFWLIDTDFVFSNSLVFISLLLLHPFLLFT